MALYFFVAVIVWLSVSSGLSNFIGTLNGDSTRAVKIAVSACTSTGFYNIHKGDCDALLNGQSSSAAEGK